MATASQSLFNMTVASDNAGGNQGLLMPKLQFRFRVNFLNFGLGNTVELTKQVMDCSRPTLTFDEITIPIYNSTMYLAGKGKWGDLTVNVRDDASGNVSKLVGQQLQKQMDFVEQATAASGQDYKFQMNIEILDGGNGTAVPTVLETWELYGCFLKVANYDTLNYGGTEPVKISMTIRYDNAVQSPLTAGVGTNVGRALNGSKGLTTGIGPSAA
jgi:hypothetical protein